MDMTSLFYFAELAKDLHITQTAKRLHTSQQTLSNHIQRLEQYFGVRLLERKPSLSLTYEGEHVLEFAKKLQIEHDNLMTFLSDAKEQERGILRVGASPLRINISLPHILPKFIQRYPKVEVLFSEDVSTELEPKVINGDLDLAVVVQEEENPALNVEHLTSGQVYLCVADSLLDLYYGDEANDIKARSISGADLADFAELPFCFYSNRLGLHIQKCFEELNITPHRYVTSINTQLSLELCFQRMAACFATQTRLLYHYDEIPDDINIFPVFYRGKPILQGLYLIWQKNRYLSRYTRYFMELLCEDFSKHEQVSIERLAKCV